MTRGVCRRVPPPPQFHCMDVHQYHSSSGDLSDGFGRLSISPACTTTHHRRGHAMLQRLERQAVHEWMSGAHADFKTVLLNQMGNGGVGCAVPRQLLPPQRVPPPLRGSLPPQGIPPPLRGGESKGKGDAPHVDLHIHINDNNIGSLSFGPPAPRDPQRNM